MKAQVEMIEEQPPASQGGGRLHGGVFRCLRCVHAVQCFDHHPLGAIQKAVKELRRECPRGESNLYVADVDTWRRIAVLKAEHKASKRGAGKPKKKAVLTALATARKAKENELHAAWVEAAKPEIPANGPKPLSVEESTKRRLARRKDALKAKGIKL